MVFLLQYLLTRVVAYKWATPAIRQGLGATKADARYYDGKKMHYCTSVPT